MPIIEKKPLVILACAIILILIGVAGYFLYLHFWGPKSVSISTYLCADGSHYVVIEEKDAIVISGSTFARVDKDASRYSNGTYEVKISGDAFTLKDIEAGTDIVTCIAGVPETGLPPILTEQQ